MNGDAMAHVNSEGTNLFLSDPHPRSLWSPLRGDAESSQPLDDGVGHGLDMGAHPPAQTENRIADQLPRAMKGDIASSRGSAERDPLFFQASG